jgi:hypothetical protein
MSPEVIKPTGNVEKPFTKGEALNGLQDFQYRKNELADGKQRLSDNIDKMNKRLKSSMDWLTADSTLDKEELKTAIEVVDGELNRLEGEYRAKVEAANKQFKAPSFSREVNIVDALDALNAGFEDFLSNNLENIINEADLADGDKGVLLARLYPKDKPAYGETEVAAINKHLRDVDKAADIQ